MVGRSTLQDHRASERANARAPPSWGRSLANEPRRPDVGTDHTKEGTEITTAPVTKEYTRWRGDRVARITVGETTVIIAVPEHPTPRNDIYSSAANLCTEAERVGLVLWLEQQGHERSAVVSVVERSCEITGTTAEAFASMPFEVLEHV